MMIHLRVSSIDSRGRAHGGMATVLAAAGARRPLSGRRVARGGPRRRGMGGGEKSVQPRAPANRPQPHARNIFRVAEKYRVARADLPINSRLA